MRAILAALSWSCMRGAARVAVAGLPGVEVCCGGDPAWIPQRIFVTLPNGAQTDADLGGKTLEETALSAMKFLGLA